MYPKLPPLFENTCPLAEIAWHEICADYCSRIAIVRFAASLHMDVTSSTKFFMGFHTTRSNMELPLLCYYCIS